MNFLSRLLSSPEKKVNWAIGFLNLSYPQMEKKYPNYKTFERKLKKAKTIIIDNPEIAIPKSIKIVKTPVLDGASAEEGYGTMNLINSMSDFTNSEWIQALSEALEDKRDAVAGAAAEVLSAAAESGTKDAMIGLSKHFSNISMDSSQFENIASTFLGCFSNAKNWQNIPEVKNAFNRLSECSNQTIKKRLHSIMVTPENVSDDSVQNIIKKILDDRCDSATPDDVLKYQEAVDELGRLLSNRNVSALEPLFTHHYWRVRKHAVMAAIIALPNISGPEYEKLLSFLQGSAQDTDDTVQAMANDYKL